MYTHVLSVGFRQFRCSTELNEPVQIYRAQRSKPLYLLIGGVMWKHGVVQHKVFSGMDLGQQHTWE